jgi:pimeloyl-ACP methyl ester carboxylesterase
MTLVHHRYTTIEGQQIFYREAGPVGSPVVVLLHGFPTGSFMFRNLIPILAERYHVIAPDLLGYGFSDSPTVDEFDYTFDALTDLVAGLLTQIGVTRYGIYVHDYGAPVGWRLALRDQDAVTAVISQSGNGYDGGFNVDIWETFWAYQREQSAENAASVLAGMTLDGIRTQYVSGVSDETVVSPDTWHYDFARLSRPGNHEVQLKLLLDYATNSPLYPQLHAWLRRREVPVLAVWGEHDPIFGPDGARGFANDTPNAEIHLLNGGHFLLESALDQVAPLVVNFLDRHIGASQ